MDIPPTQRLVFRRVRAEDADLLAELNAHPDVMRFLTGGRPQPRAEIETVLIPRYLDEYARGVAGRWLAHERRTGEFLGWFGLDSDSGAPDEREIGYRLHASAWGCGYATEGAVALVEHGFVRLELRRIWGTTMAVNLGSRRVLEKAGLRYVRTVHLEWDDPSGWREDTSTYPIDGAEHGEVEYELLRSDWVHGG